MILNIDCSVYIAKTVSIGIKIIDIVFYKHAVCLLDTYLLSLTPKNNIWQYLHN